MQVLAGVTRAVDADDPEQRVRQLVAHERPRLEQRRHAFQLVLVPDEERDPARVRLAPWRRQGRVAAGADRQPERRFAAIVVHDRLADPAAPAEDEARGAERLALELEPLVVGALRERRPGRVMPAREAVGVVGVDHVGPLAGREQRLYLEDEVVEALAALELLLDELGAPAKRPWRKRRAAPPGIASRVER